MCTPLSLSPAGRKRLKAKVYEEATVVTMRMCVFCFHAEAATVRRVRRERRNNCMQCETLTEEIIKHNEQEKKKQKYKNIKILGNKIDGFASAQRETRRDE